MGLLIYYVQGYQVGILIGNKKYLKQKKTLNFVLLFDRQYTTYKKGWWSGID